MTKRTISSLFSIVAISALTIGCGSSSTTPKNPQEAPTVTTLTDSQIDGGVITAAEGVSISDTSEDNTASSTITLPTGTKFQDAGGNTLNNVIPKVSIDSTTQTNTNKVEIKLTDSNGNKIIPTENVTVKIKAPTGTNPGDEVKVTLPEGASKADGQQKIVIFIVDTNGFLSIIIPPSVFKRLEVIIISVKKKVYTGATGAN